MGDLARHWFDEICEDARDLVKAYPEGVSSWSLVDYYGMGYRTALKIIRAVPFSRRDPRGAVVNWVSVAARQISREGLPTVGCPPQLIWPRLEAADIPLPLLSAPEVRLLLALHRLAANERVEVDAALRLSLSDETGLHLLEVSAALDLLMDVGAVELISLTGWGAQRLHLRRGVTSINQDMRDFVAGRGARFEMLQKRKAKKGLSKRQGDGG